MVRAAIQRIAIASSLCAAAMAHAQTTPPQQLPSVTVTAKASEAAVEKSYRKMIRAMDYFERNRALAPGAPLRFKLLPRKRETDMNAVAIEVVGNSIDFTVPVAPDHTFVLQRNQKAFDENALVIPNRKKQTMTWRTDIRTPGLAEGTRRLGDLRLECRVGMEAGLISNHKGFLGGLVSAFLDTPGYCDKAEQRYLFFAEKPLFNVTLIAGARSEIMPVSQLFAGASEDPQLQDALPFCDCEVLADRAYFLPLADRSWPDDTLVAFEFIDGAAGGAVAPGLTRQEVEAQRGPAKIVRLDSGQEVWVYRAKPPKDKPRADQPEVVVLFSPAGVVQASRVRPAYAASP